MSQAMNGFLSGLGQGIAEVGKTAFNAQIEQAREQRLRQYQTEDRAQARADQKEDYATSRADKLADVESDRTYQKGETADERTYQEKVTKGNQAFQSSQADKQQANAVSNAQTKRGWDKEDAKQANIDLAEKLKTEGQKVKSVNVLDNVTTDEFGTKISSAPERALVTYENGESQMLDLKTGTYIPNQLDPAVAQSMAKDLIPEAKNPAQAPTYSGGASPGQQGASGAGLLTWKPPTQ